MLGLWEKEIILNLIPSNSVGLKNEAESDSFSLTLKRWIISTNDTGLISESRQERGTFAHQDIAFEFVSWIFAEFKLYLIKEFQKLKEEETKRLSTGWEAKRQLIKYNYRIDNDSVQRKIVLETIQTKQENVPFVV